jgi:ferrous iron transport protein A
MNKPSSLHDLSRGQTGIIAAIKARGEMGRRIRDMGLIPGVSVTLRGRAPLQDPIAIQVRDGIITLRKQEAELIALRRPESL